MSDKHQAFITNFRDLVLSVTDSVMSLADTCLGLKLISQDTYGQILDLNETKSDKARRLLWGIGISIERNSSAFDTFIIVLNEADCQAESKKLSSALLEMKKREPIKPPSVIEILDDKNLQELVLTPYASGDHVVDLCIQKLKQWINDENKFMKRVAFVMTEFGRRMSTYGPSGGIWQVSLIAFQDTKNHSAHWTLPRKYERIMHLYQIDWLSVSYADLDKPLYSALAARLYLSNDPVSIPPCHDVSEQAAYWKYHYMKGEGGKTSVYSDRVLMLEK